LLNDGKTKKKLKFFQLTKTQINPQQNQASKMKDISNKEHDKNKNESTC
jgi:hypothetical protein